MKRFNYLFFVGLFLFFGAIGLNRFASDQVRFVNALGLFASGMGCGASLCGFIVALRARRGLMLFPKRDQPVSPSAPDELRTGNMAGDQGWTASQQQASCSPSDHPSFFGIPPLMGVWRHLGAHFWGGALFGTGIGLLLAAALVEQELLTLQHKAWVSVTGILLAVTGQGIVRRAVSRDQQPKEDKTEKS